MCIKGRSNKGEIATFSNAINHVSSHHLLSTICLVELRALYALLFIETQSSMLVKSKASGARLSDSNFSSATYLQFICELGQVI